MKCVVMIVAFGLVGFSASAEVAIPKAAMQASFEQGLAGEPFTVEALVQGCGVTDEVDGCTFYAEGVRWVVSHGGTNNEAALTAMALMPVNTPLIVTGDLISMGDITVEAAVAKIEPGTPDAFAQMRNDMQGKWVSTDDPKASFEMIGSEQTDSYEGQVMAVSVVTFADACPGAEPVGPVFFSQQMGGDPMDLPCYSMVSVTPERLELSYVGRGNTLIYQRP